MSPKPTQPAPDADAPATVDKGSTAALQALQRYFGFSTFREGQGEIIASILQGSDTLVIMPTGGGKSLCYQLPALVLPGVTLVVSPLIALMKDQVDSLRQKNIPADFINSTLSAKEQRERIQAMRDGSLKLVYVAPERFRSPSFFDALREVSVSLFAIDEAHCISQWGHDFRPDYYKIGSVLAKLDRPQVVALTATASPAVRSDILRALHLENAEVFVAGFSRPNLSLKVCHTSTESEKFETLRALIARRRTGIVYCATRKKVDLVSERLKSWKVSHVSYHGGMDESARTRAQERFLDGSVDVVVATNAFGMGIDRSDLRFIAHFEIPGSIEAYYQEVGRAGRDGLPSECELYFCHPDVRVQEFFIDGSNPGYDMIVMVWNTLRRLASSAQTVESSVADLALLIPGCKNDMTVSNSLTILGRHGYLERYDIPGSLLRGTRLLRPEVRGHELEIDRTALEAKEKVDRDRLRLMIDFAYSRECRQRFILRALGEHHSERCGVCDICDSGTREGAREGSPEELLLLKKLLSCVARMSWKRPSGWEGRFGKQRILQVLLGSRSRLVTEAGLDRLSTYGILREPGEPYVSLLLREALDAGFLTTGGGQYPVITLSQEGETVMKSREACVLCWPPLHSGVPRQSLSDPSGRPKKASSPAESAKGLPELPPEARELYSILREERLRMASEKNLPPYVIAHDRLLGQFALERPMSDEAALRIPGVGQRKLDLYLRPFLDRIRTFSPSGKIAGE